MKAFLFLFTVLVGVIAQPPQLVTEFDISVIDVNFDCASYPLCQTINTRNLYWGLVADECPDAELPSGIQYIFPEDQTIPLGGIVNLGYIASRNVIIQGSAGNPDDVTMTLTIDINDILLDVDIDLEIDETSNAVPCSYSTGADPEVPCPDLHTYTIPDMTQFMLGNETYELDFIYPGNVDVITPEMCTPEMVVATGFQGEPEDLPATIFCASCCPIYLWGNYTAPMYIPWTFYIQKTPATNNMEPTEGSIRLISAAGYPDKTIFDNVVIDDFEINEFTWSPSQLYPGYYQVVFDGTDVEDCSYFDIRIVVPADYPY